MIGTKWAAKWKNKTVINACETGDGENTEQIGDYATRSLLLINEIAIAAAKPKHCT